MLLDDFLKVINKIFDLRTPPLLIILKAYDKFSIENQVAEKQVKQPEENDDDGEDFLEELDLHVDAKDMMDLEIDIADFLDLDNEELINMIDSVMTDEALLELFREAGLEDLFDSQEVNLGLDQ